MNRRSFLGSLIAAPAAAAALVKVQAALPAPVTPHTICVGGIRDIYCYAWETIAWYKGISNIRGQELGVMYFGDAVTWLDTDFCPHTEFFPDLTQVRFHVVPPPKGWQVRIDQGHIHLELLGYHVNGTLGGLLGTPTE